MKRIQKKVCLLGDFSVGKTSLIRRYVEGRFDDKYLTTVGVVVSRKTVEYPDLSLHMLIWDLAGGRDFRQSSSLVGVSGALIVCDLTRPVTLSSYQTYADQLRQFNPDVSLVLLANKQDLTNERAISEEQLMAISQETGSPLLYTSAKTGTNVEEAFGLLAEMIIMPHL